MTLSKWIAMLSISVAFSSCRKSSHPASGKPQELERKELITSREASPPSAPKLEEGNGVQHSGSTLFDAETVAKMMSERHTDNFFTASRQFEEVLPKFVGKSKDDFMRTFGKPDEERPTILIYSFDAGFGGLVWEIHHDGKTITSFERTSSQ